MTSGGNNTYAPEDRGESMYTKQKILLGSVDLSIVLMILLHFKVL